MRGVVEGPGTGPGVDADAAGVEAEAGVETVVDDEACGGVLLLVALDFMVDVSEVVEPFWEDEGGREPMDDWVVGA